MKFGYALVLTNDQNLGTQLDALAIDTTLSLILNFYRLHSRR